MIGYPSDDLTTLAALQAWASLYPDDTKQLESGASEQIQAPPTVPTASWGYGTVSRIGAGHGPLFHWTDVSNLERWKDPSHTGPGETYMTESGDDPAHAWNPDVPYMEHPIRITIDPAKLDPDAWDRQYAGWNANHLYHGVVPPEAVLDIRPFKAPEHWGKVAEIAEQPGTQTELPIQQSSSQAAMSHTGQIAGDEDLMGDFGALQPNPNSGINRSYITTDANNREVYVKPEGTWHSDDLAKERAAFAIAHTMGIDMPHTIVREVPVPKAGYDTYGYPTTEPKISQVQHGIEGAPLFKSHEFHDALHEFPEDMRRIALLDNVIGNGDRHLGNIVLGHPPGAFEGLQQEDQLYPIDHGGAFGSNNRSYGTGNMFKHEPLTPEEEEMLQRAMSVNVRDMGLNDEHQLGVDTRIRTMLDSGHFL